MVSAAWGGARRLGWPGRWLGILAGLELGDHELLLPDGLLQSFHLRFEQAQLRPELAEFVVFGMGRHGQRQDDQQKDG